MFYPRDCAKGEFHRHRHVTLPLSEDVGQRDQETHDLRENAGMDRFGKFLQVNIAMEQMDENCHFFDVDDFQFTYSKW